MCDALVATGDATADGITLFGKNSDREPNEAHVILRLPRTDHPPGEPLQCTYAAIPQVGETFEVLLAKPFWTWGAEMGANEHGVAIGNEALFTRIPCDREGGLTGLDLVRLGLERATSAREALDTITELLEAHGQGGNCGLAHPIYYHNSFIIADPAQAWVLETAGKHWAAQKVRGIRTISNGITIHGTWDLASAELVDEAVRHGWCRGREDFDFARCYSDALDTRFGCAQARHQRTTEVLEGHRGHITAETVCAALRDHGPASPDAGPDWTPAKGLMNRQICQHAGAGPIRADQSTGSMVSHLAPGLQTHFVTGTAAPCTGLFKPVWLTAQLPDMGPAPTARCDDASLFWRHERLHRAVLPAYARRLSLYRDDRDALEARFMAQAMRARETTAEHRALCSRECFAEADVAEARWTECVLSDRGPTCQGALYTAAWRRRNRSAGM